MVLNVVCHNEDLRPVTSILKQQVGRGRLSETSVTNYPSTLRNILEERWPQFSTNRQKL